MVFQRLALIFKEIFKYFSPLFSLLLPSEVSRVHFWAIFKRGGPYARGSNTAMNIIGLEHTVT